MAYQGTAILGTPTASIDQMRTHLASVNPTAPDLAGLYLTTGARLGVRGDVAFAQAMLETNYLRFGGLVLPWQNNFGGIGATGPGQHGACFATPEEGVLAHIEHLFAYAATGPLPADLPKVDPRFDLVLRGSAPYVGDLSGKWATDPEYGRSIDRILGLVLTATRQGEPYQITRAYLSSTSQNRPGVCSDSYCWEGLKGIVVHRTASNTMDAAAIRHYFDTAPDGRHASSQFVVDNTQILQLMPIGEVAYHASSANPTHLGIETCEHNWGTDTWQETYRKLVWLTSFLVRMFSLTVDDVSGHFKWDPVNRPYDPAKPGWKPSDGKAKGIFSWEQFLVDVRAEVERQCRRPGSRRHRSCRPVIGSFPCR